MAATTPDRMRDGATTPSRRDSPGRRLVTETKSALKTTEFAAFVAVLFGILVAAAIVDQSDAGGLGARQAWLYATILTVGYMISRGLAKSGSHQPYDETHS